MVTFDGGDCGEPENGIIYCGIEGDLLEVGPDVDWFFPLVKVDGGETGPAGTITATIEHAGTDPNPANNSVTADVVLSDEPGVDLLVWAPDVYEWDDEAQFFTEEPITPGGTSRVYVEVLNQGDATADGFKVQLQLPKYATLAEPEPDCVFAADLRSATCEYKQLWLDPFQVSGTYHRFYWKIDISEDATGPALTGGAVTIDALGVKEVEEPTLLKGATADLPEQFQDADVTDNSDEYSVFVAEGGEGGGGALPVTGPAATAMTVGGGAIVLLGAVLLVVTRRRKVVIQA
jgi:LPXTG-motif cell wall-anchored protein